MRGAKVHARGFTLVEMLLMLAILGVVAAFGLPIYQRFIERGRVHEATVQLSDISKAVTAYERANGALPASLAAVNLARNDPWGNQYRYFNLRTATGNGHARKDKKLAPLNSDFDLFSLGKDGLSQENLGHAYSRDDIVRARDGAFIGAAEEFDP
jgi:general secretion pathway protein G